MFLSIQGRAYEAVCNIDNYMEYAYNDKKTEELIEKTGKGCYLREANFISTNLKSANFKWANLIFTNLTKANLKEANLEWTNFKLANFRNANLEGANLKRAILIYTNLIGANLKKANLTDASLKGAIYNDDTTLPEGFDPQNAGMVHISKYDYY